MTASGLTTTLRGPLPDLARRMLDAMPLIEGWLRAQWPKRATPFYASVDLRNSGFQLAPVDTNLFPAGFNNLNPEFEALCVQATMAAIENINPAEPRVLLIPENHTRNTFYLQSVVALQRILRHAGLIVRIGSLRPDITAATDIELPGGDALRLEPLERSGKRICVHGFDPDIVLLNHDLSDGLPEILRNLDQHVLPPLHAGWFMRRKANHFAAYRDAAEECSRLLGTDPWLIGPYFERCGRVDFSNPIDQESLAGYVSKCLDDIRAKYREYGIEQEPFVIVKPDAGTYGMGIMTVRDPRQVRNLNHEQRKHLAMVKGHIPAHEVLVQEGVYTVESVGDATAEPVVYMIDRFVIGGFYRVHPGRGWDENLNGPGAHFAPLAIEKPCYSTAPGRPPNLFFYAYSVIARLALVAAAIEIERTAEAFESGPESNAS
jgi:glutamate--cysteine ligase